MTQRRYSHVVPAEAEKLFHQDRAAMEEQGLVPHSQEWSVENKRLRPDTHHLTVTYRPEEEWTGIKIRPSGTVAVNVTTAQEAKEAIAQLKLYKKELAVKKKELSAQQARVRAGATSKSAFLGAKRNTSAQLVRGYQRQQTANAVASIGENKNAIDRLVIGIDRLIIQLDQKAKGG